MAEREPAGDPALPRAEAARESSPDLRVLLGIADFPLLLAGYRHVIGAAPGLRVVGVVEHAVSLDRQAVQLAAEIVVLEARPSTCPGLPLDTTIAAVRLARPAARILAVDCGGGVERLAGATAIGADGVLARDATAAEVLTAIRRLGRGETWTSPSSAAATGATPVPGTAPVCDDAFAALSEGTREVFRLAAIGHSSREIARRLNVSERTVHDHRATIMEKLGLHRRVELLCYALRRGIISATEL